MASLSVSTSLEYCQPVGVNSTSGLGSEIPLDLNLTGSRSFPEADVMSVSPLAAAPGVAEALTVLSLRSLPSRACTLKWYVVPLTRLPTVIVTSPVLPDEAILVQAAKSKRFAFSDCLTNHPSIPVTSSGTDRLKTTCAVPPVAVNATSVACASKSRSTNWLSARLTGGGEGRVGGEGHRAKDGGEGQGHHDGQADDWGKSSCHKNTPFGV